MTVKIKGVTIECADDMTVEVDGNTVRVKPAPSPSPQFVPVPYPVERHAPFYPGPIWITTSPAWRQNEITCGSTEVHS